jgi:hypothetical protein
VTDAELIKEWLSLHTADEIAAEYGVARIYILREWRRLKVVGALPFGDRPRRNDSKYRQSKESNHDGRPSVGEDELLAKLERGER